MGSCASINLRERSAFYSQFVLREKIGQGSYGKVYLVKDKRHNKTLAVKVQAAQFGREWVITDEVVVWKQLGKHPNIVSFHDLRQEANVYFILMEVCPRALSDRVMYAPQWTATELTYDFKQALLGLQHMHGRRIIHRDIKVQNFLYGGQDESTLKLADFGLSVMLRPGEKLDAVCGSPAFMAPEMVARQGYDLKIDMWSLGVTFFMMMFGTLLVGKPKMSVPEMKEAIKSPAATKNSMQMALHKADACEGEERVLKHAALDVVKQMTTRDPLLRLGTKDALKLPFIQLTEEASKEEYERYDKLMLVDRPPAKKSSSKVEPDPVRSGKPPLVSKPAAGDQMVSVVPGTGSGAGQPSPTNLAVPNALKDEGKRRAKTSNVIFDHEGQQSLPRDLPRDSSEGVASPRVEGGASSMKLQRFKSAGSLGGGRRGSQFSKVSAELGLAGDSDGSLRMSVTNCLMQAYRGGSRRLTDSGLLVRAQGSGILSPDSSYALGGFESFSAVPSDDAALRRNLAPPHSARSFAVQSAASSSRENVRPVELRGAILPFPKSRADGPGTSSPFLFVSEDVQQSSLKLPGSIREGSQN